MVQCSCKEREREKGKTMCNYCGNGEYKFDLMDVTLGEESNRVWIDEGEKRLHSMTVLEDGTCGEDWSVDIDFCPVCGRRL